MKRVSRFLAVLVFWALVVHAADSVNKSIHGNISKLETSPTKIIVVKLRDGSTRTLQFLDNTKVLGVEMAAAGSDSAFKGLSEGSEVVVHYWDKDGWPTTYEIYKVGKDGLKYVDGTITKVDKGGKTVVVKATNGTLQTFEVWGSDKEDLAKQLEKYAGKSETVTVYFTEDGGKKIAHFFDKI